MKTDKEWSSQATNCDNERKIEYSRNHAGNTKAGVSIELKQRMKTLFKTYYRTSTKTNPALREHKTDIKIISFMRLTLNIKNEATTTWNVTQFETIGNVSYM